MKRALFVNAMIAAAALRPNPASAAVREGERLTQRALFASLPKPKPGDWTRIILGSGAKYQKQIGIGVERTASGSALPYYEVEVGSPGGSCNPNSLRKAYLSGTFGSLIDTYPLLANVGRTENFVYRYADRAAGQHGENGDTHLRLLDEAYLYDPRELQIVSVAPQRIHVASRDVLATHIVGRFGAPSSSHQRLAHVELWTHPAFPFGVARYTATLRGLDPYELHCYSLGTNYKTGLALGLEAVRKITPDGQYGQLPDGLGA